MGNGDGAAAIGARLRQRRIELGWTQSQVGEPEFSAGYISMIEGGHRRPSDDKLSVIAGRLGMDLRELVSGIPAGIEAQLELQLHLSARRADEGEVDAAATAMKEVLEEAQRHRLNRVEARAEEALAAIAERNADHAEALTRFERAQDLWRREAIHLRASAVTGKAKCLRMLGDPHAAIHSLDYYRRDLVETRQPHPDALMQTYSEMVYAYFAIGLPEQASEAAREALRLESQVEDAKGLACMHLTVAQSLLYEQRFSDALDSIRRAHELYSGGGWRTKAAKAQIAEAFVLCNSGEYEAARERLMEALEVLRASPSRVDEALALDQLGHVMRHLGDARAAIGFLERAGPHLQGCDIRERAFNARELGLSLRNAGETPSAEQHLRRAIDLYRSARAREELAGTYKDLGELFVSLDRREEALQVFHEGLQSVEKGVPR